MTNAKRIISQYNRSSLNAYEVAVHKADPVCKESFRFWSKLRVHRVFHFIITGTCSATQGFFYWYNHVIIRRSKVRTICGGGRGGENFRFHLPNCFNCSFRRMRMRIIVERKTSLGRKTSALIANRRLQLCFQYFTAQCSGNSSAWLKVSFQYQPITFRKQEQHHFTCRCLGFELIFFRYCGVFPISCAGV